ncbi:hypothetical protein [Deinococcus sp. UYEF24]
MAELDEGMKMQAPIAEGEEHIANSQTTQRSTSLNRLRWAAVLPVAFYVYILIPGPVFAVIDPSPTGHWSSIIHPITFAAAALAGVHAGAFTAPYARTETALALAILLSFVLGFYTFARFIYVPDDFPLLRTVLAQIVAVFVGIYSVWLICRPSTHKRVLTDG